MKNHDRRSSEGGFLLIEALVAILIFSLGILGLVAMGGTAIGAQSDAHFRTDAAKLTEDLASEVALHAVRIAGKGVDPTSLDKFKHQDADGDVCAFSGDKSTDAVVTDWIHTVETTGPGLPGLPAAALVHGEQIKIFNDAAGYNRIEVTVCWQTPGAPANAPMRHHTLVTYIN